MPLVMVPASMHCASNCADRIRTCSQRHVAQTKVCTWMAGVVGKNRYNPRCHASVSSSRMVLVVGLGTLPPNLVLIHLTAHLHHGTLAVPRQSDFLASGQTCSSKYLRNAQSPEHIRDHTRWYIETNGHSHFPRLRWIQSGQFFHKAESVYATSVGYVVGSDLLWTNVMSFVRVFLIEGTWNGIIKSKMLLYVDLWLFR